MGQLAWWIFQVLNWSKKDISVWIARGLIVKFLVGLGVGLVTYNTMGYFTDMALGYVHTNVQGLPSDIANLLAIARIPEALSVLASAWTARAVIISGRITWRLGVPFT